jgi:diguanylate cyclase (GGDEF)-like protein
MERSAITSSTQKDLRRLTRIIGGAIAFAGVLLIAIIAYTGWTSNASEIAAEQARVENALNQNISRTLDQQKSVAWWDDAVINISHKLDLDFTDSNFGIFLTETYGHDEVYILDSEGRPVYAFLDGARAEPSAFHRHEPQLSAVITGVRGGSSGGLRDRPDVFGASQENYDVLKGVLQWARWSGNILLIDGKPAIVTAITIVPNVDLSLLKGTPYLLVSVVQIDDKLVSELGQSLLLPDLKTSTAVAAKDGVVSAPFVVDDGQFAGYLTWTTKRPGHILLTVILPLVIIGVIGAGILSAVMLRRLATASAELAEREATATYEAKHDPLSGLPNRHYFALRTDQALKERSAAGTQLPSIVCYLDVDRFKDINDTLGHHTGDELIKRVAKRLTDCLAPGDFLARFGGDEFAILRCLSGSDDPEPLEKCIEAAFKRPFSVDGQDIRVTASLGLARSPDHGVTTDVLMQHADIALYEAKKRGRDQSVFFSAEMAGQLQQRRQIELELRESLHAGELELHYQPIVSCATNRIIGVEALLRWFHPRNGSIPPAIFIPIAEEAGMMPELGEWVLRTAMNNAARWPELEISINLSPAQFRHVDLEGLLKGLLESTAVDPKRITLEITEGLLLDRSNKTRSTLQAIRNLGFRIALDDFGTGFSSLRYLIDFRFDKLKIDRSFVSGMSRVGSAKTIVQTVIDLGRTLSMDVIAEGVENEAEAVMMRFLGCHSMQGYFFSKPVPSVEIEALLTTFNGSTEIEPAAWAGMRARKKQAQG